jgi:hypothetical protein
MRILHIITVLATVRLGVAGAAAVGTGADITGITAGQDPRRVVQDVLPMGAAPEISEWEWVPPYVRIDPIATPKEGTALVRRASVLTPTIQVIDNLIREIHKALNRRRIPEAYGYATELARTLWSGVEAVEMPVEQLEPWWAMRQWGIEAIAETQRLYRLVNEMPAPTLADGIDLYRSASYDAQPRLSTTPDTRADWRPARPSTQASKMHTVAGSRVMAMPTQYVTPRPRQPTLAIRQSRLGAKASPLPRTAVTPSRPTTARSLAPTGSGELFQIAEDTDVVDPTEPIRIVSRRQSTTLRNKRTINVLHELAMYMTSTPIWSQVVTYRMCADGEATIPNQALVLSRIQEQWDLLQTFTLDLVGRYPELEDIIVGAIRAKNNSYREFLRHVRAYIQATPIAQFRAVDRGQTSGSSRNTCMFNSLFSQDVSMGNIHTTKGGAVSAGLMYLGWLTDYYSRYSETADDPLMNPGGIRAHLLGLQRDNNADQEYGPGVEFAMDGFVPGQLSDCSAAEAQCHALGLNYMVMPKQRTGRGDSMESYFGTAYLGSEHYPTVLVSCSMYHAQGMERVTTSPKLAYPGIKGPIKL